MEEKSAKKFLILLFFLLAWFIGYMLFLFNIDMNRISPENINPLKERYDAIIVTTGGSNRVKTGFELLQKGAARKLFISGTHPDAPPKEVVKSSGVEISKKLLKCCVTFGRSAIDTKTNAREVKAWLEENEDVKAILLVTSDYHMPRTLMEFKPVLSSVRVKPVSVRSSLSSGNTWEYFQVTFIEYNKTLITWINTHILPAS